MDIIWTICNWIVIVFERIVIVAGIAIFCTAICKEDARPIFQKIYKILIDFNDEDDFYEEGL